MRIKSFLLFLLIFALSSCKNLAVCQNKEIDTSYLYFPFKILFSDNSFELSVDEKKNLDYILDKYYFPYKNDLKSDISLTVYECDKELISNPFLAFQRLQSIYNYLVFDKGIDKAIIIMFNGGVSVKPNCDGKGVVIQYRLKPN
jgi:hypothetical protein